MQISIIRTIIIAGVIILFASFVSAQECVECHKKITPHIVSDWGLSKHSTRNVGCTACHGDQHKSAQDVEKVKIPLPDTCASCHEKQVRQFMIRDADRLMAGAIRIVSDLYKDGILAKPEKYAQAFPDLLTFHDAPTVIEQKLFIMFLEHRMRTFQGAFHANPDYALWYGWSM